MARKKNKLKTTRITISTNAAAIDLLNKLVLTGLYGKTITEAAERLLMQRIASDPIIQGILNKQNV